MLTPTGARDWAVLLVIVMLGAAAFVGIIPWAVRHPFVMPPDVYRASPARRPYAEIMNFTPVFAGVAIVAACAALYAAWIGWSSSRPVVLQRPRDRG